MQQRHVALAACAALWLAAQPARGEADPDVDGEPHPDERARESTHAPTSQATDYDEILVTTAPHPRSRPRSSASGPLRPGHGHSPSRAPVPGKERESNRHPVTI